MQKFAFAAASIAMLGITHGHAFNVSPTTQHRVTTKPTTTVSKAAKPIPAKTTPAPVMVTVQSGDNLSSIASAHQSTYVRLYDANPVISDPDVITTGQQLRVPTADEQLADRPLPAAAVPVATADTTVAAAVPVSKASYAPVSGNSAKAMIYARESGNNPNSTSPSGCYGLGQDCNGRVRTQCGADYACQDAYFTNYANSRYGSWEGAAAFWNANGWW